MTTDARRTLWMLVDLEPGYDALRVGDVIEGSAVWFDAGTEIQDSPLPGEILSTDVAGVVGDGDGPHCVLDLGALGSVLARARDGAGSTVLLSGTPMFDRYAWATSRLRSKVRGRIVRTGVLVRPYRTPADPDGTTAPVCDPGRCGSGPCRRGTGSRPSTPGGVRASTGIAWRSNP
ncbi:hypothetical protein [Rhodococcus sp. TAF43]|uniref:hypothetical protein n=1 Tax=Rhodococcus sp. TAF43 TaxID=3237483 RepID=UPI003F97C679